MPEVTNAKGEVVAFRKMGTRKVFVAAGVDDTGARARADSGVRGEHKVLEIKLCIHVTEFVAVRARDQPCPPPWPSGGRRRAFVTTREQAELIFGKSLLCRTCWGEVVAFRGK